MKSLVAFVILAGLASSVSIGEQDADLDPGRITWWEDSWSSASIVPNEFDTSATSLTFRIRLEHAITSGVFEIEAPHTGGTPISGSVAITANADEDIVATVTGLTLLAGYYGPFTVMTRSDATDGRIYDKNVAFGSVYISSTVTPSATLNVDLGYGTTIDSGATENLVFSFSLGTDIDVWAHDQFVLTVDGDLELEADIECISYNVGADSDENYLCTPSGTDTYCAIECEATGDNEITIYGLNQDIMGGDAAKDVSLNITGFTFPEAAYTLDGQFATWTLDVMRFGTDTVIAQYTTGTVQTGITIGTGSVTCTGPTAVNVPLASIFTGMTTHVQYVCTATHAIPSAGMLQVTFTGLTNLDSNDGGGGAGVCYSSIGGCADSAGSVVDITGFDDDVAAGTAITIKVYGTFAATTKITDASTYLTTAGTTAIDSTTTDQASHTVTSGLANVALAVELDDDNNGSVTTVDDMTADFLLMVIPQISTTPTSLKVTCPFGDDLALSTIQFPGSATWTAATTLDLSAGSTPNLDPVRTGNDIEFANAQANGGTTLYDYDGGANSFALTAIRAPLVASNVATFYECYMIAADATGTTDVGADAFTVSADSVGDGSGTLSEITAQLICTAGVAGMPIIITVDPEIDLAAGYIIELTVTNNFDLRGTEAPEDSVPVHPTTYTGVLASTTVAEITAPALANGNTDKIYVPVGADGVIAGVRLFSRSGSVENVILDVSITGAARVTVGTDSLDDSATLAVGEAGNMGVDAGTITAGDYIGFANLDLAIVGLTGTSISGPTADETIILTADDDDFVSSAVFIQSTGTVGAGTFSVTPKSAGAFGGAYQVTTVNGACTLSESFGLTATAGSLTATISPATVAESGTGFDFTVTIGTTNDIPEGGEVTFTINSGFAIVADGACEVSGVGDMADGTSPDCAVASSVVTVSTFGAVTGGTSIVVTFTDVKGGAAAGTVNCLSADPTTTDGTNDIDTLTAATGDCTVSAAVAPVHATSFSAEFYPNASGVKADVYITFKSTRELPSGTTLNIDYSGTESTSGTTCWANFDFSDCTVSAGGIEFTTSEAIAASATIEVYVDNAITPSLTDPAQYFEVTATWESVDIVDDSDTTGGRTATTHTVTINAAVTEMTTAPTVSASVTNPGAYSDYEFTYTPTVDVESTDVLWFSFPVEFDPYVGYADQTFEASGDDHFYMSCMVDGADAECYVDHWIVFVTGVTLSNTTASTVTIEDVVNPTGTSHTIAYYHVDADGDLKDFNDGIALTLTAEVPAHIDIKSVATTSHTLSATGEYTIQFYTPAANVDVAVGDLIGVWFPYQYSLDLEGVTAPGCTLTSAATAGDVTVSGSCGQDMNSVALNATATATITAGDLVTFTISGIPNPQTGFTRDYNTATETDYDVYDDAIDADLFTAYSFWTEDFAVMIEEAGVLTHHSSENTDAAYVGLSDGDADDYSIEFVTDERITVCKGMTSGMYTIEPANGKPLMVDSVTITGTPSTVTLNQYGTMMYEGDTELYFSVAAPIGTSEDVYTIEWTVVDDTTDCGDLYGPLSRTLVEVYDCDAETIVVDSSIVVIGTTSVPVGIWLTHAPATELIVTIAVNSTVYELSDETVTFAAGESEYYFYVESDDDVTESNTISFTLSGTDAAAYAAPSDSTLEHEDPPATVGSLTTSLSTSANSATATADSSSSGVVYWYFTCSQAADSGNIPVVALDDIVDLFDVQLDQDDDDDEDEDEDEDEDMTTAELFSEMIHEHCAGFEFGAEVIEGSSISVDVDDLSDGTTYTFGAYLVDTAGNSPADDASNPSTATESTSAVQALRTATLVFSGSSAIADSESDVACTVAMHMNVPLALLHLESSTVVEANATAGTTASTTLVYTVAYDRFDASNTPTGYTGMVVTDDLESDLEDQFESDSDLTGVSYTASAFSESEAPTFTTAPAEDDNDDESIEFIATADGDGYWCTVCVDDGESDAEISPTGWQVFYGLSAASNSAGYGCVATEAATEVTNIVEDLGDDADYICYHALCTNNWHTPTCTISATITESSTDNASLLALFGLVLALILN